MNIFFLTLLFGLILWLQVPSLLQEKKKKPLIVYGILMFLAMLYSYTYALDIKMPNPSTAVEFVFKPLTQMIGQMLE